MQYLQLRRKGRTSIFRHTTNFVLLANSRIKSGAKVSVIFLSALGFRFVIGKMGNFKLVWTDDLADSEVIGLH